METVHEGQLPNLIDNLGDTSLRLLVLKSSYIGSCCWSGSLNSFYCRTRWKTLPQPVSNISQQSLASWYHRDSIKHLWPPSLATTTDSLKTVSTILTDSKMKRTIIMVACIVGLLAASTGNYGYFTIKYSYRRARQLTGDEGLYLPKW